MAVFIYNCFLPLKRPSMPGIYMQRPLSNQKIINFREAIIALGKGQKIQSTCWEGGRYIYFNSDNELRDEQDRKIESFRIETKADWEILE